MQVFHTLPSYNLITFQVKLLVPFTSLTSSSDTVLLVCPFTGRLDLNKSLSFRKNEASELKTILEKACESEVHKKYKTML